MKMKNASPQVQTAWRQTFSFIFAAVTKKETALKTKRALCNRQKVIKMAVLLHDLFIPLYTKNIVSIICS